MKIAPYEDEKEGFALPIVPAKPSTAPSRDESHDEADEASEKDIEKEQPIKDVEAGVPAEHQTPAGQHPADPNIVQWGGPTDEDNPQNWSTLKKVFVFGQICLLTFASECACQRNVDNLESRTDICDSLQRVCHHHAG
jgi:hypothetical protein